MFELVQPASSTTKNLLVSGKVTAAERIPQGVLSQPIVVETLRGETDIVQLSVFANSSGILTLDPQCVDSWHSNVHWARALRLADDCHSYNIQLIKDHTTSTINGKCNVMLQVIRPIEAGQELLLWFSEDLLAVMSMVFLSPTNIQGQKNYVCTRCSALYESPNPLKVHLTLGCDHANISWLWEKLARALLSPPTPRKCNGFQFKLIQENCKPKQRSAIDLSSSSSSASSSTPAKLKDDKSQSGSAFKPYNLNLTPSAMDSQRLLTKATNNNLMYSYAAYNNNPWPRFTMPHDYVHTPYEISHHLAATPAAGAASAVGVVPPLLPGFARRHPHAHGHNNEAQLETIVSSLGKFKEGHVCLYCGKSYSRKYGLKIHIRTHTGYKPLKCKFCLRPFGDPSNLNKHVRLHAEGETPYKCDICGKILVRRRDLERHLKSRHSTDSTGAYFPDEDDDEEVDSLHSTGSISDDERKSLLISLNDNSGNMLTRANTENLIADTLQHE